LENRNDNKLVKISDNALINRFFQAKIDYTNGKSYFSFAQDITQLFLLVLAAFDKIPILLVVFIGLGAMLSFMTFGIVLRKKNYIQREGSLSAKLSPPTMSLLEGQEKIIKMLEDIKNGKN